MATNEDTNPPIAVEAEDEDRWKGVPLGSCCFKIPLFMHWSFYFLLCAMLFLAVLTWSAKFALFCMALTLIIFFSVLVHELAKAWVTKLVGGQTEDIVLWPLGGLTLSNSNSARAEFLIALVGPLSHIPLIVVFGMLFSIIRPQNVQFNRVIDLIVLETVNGFLAELSLHAFLSNIVILLANVILPTYPLDGGRLLASFLIMIGCSTVKAAKIIGIWTMLVSVGLIIYGAYLLFTDEYYGIFLMVIGALNFSGGSNLKKMANDGRIKEDPLFGRPCFNEGPAANETEMRTVSSNEAEII